MWSCVAASCARLTVAARTRRSSSRRTASRPSTSRTKSASGDTRVSRKSPRSPAIPFASYTSPRLQTARRSSLAPATRPYVCVHSTRGDADRAVLARVSEDQAREEARRLAAQSVQVDSMTRLALCRSSSAVVNQVYHRPVLMRAGAMAIQEGGVTGSWVWRRGSKEATITRRSRRACGPGA